MYNQSYGNPYYAQQLTMYCGFPYPYVENLVRSTSSNFSYELLQYEIPHSTIIPNILKYGGTTNLDDHINI